MISNNIHYWDCDAKQIITVTAREGLGDYLGKDSLLLNKFTVDCRSPSEDHRFGIWTEDQKWSHIPLEAMPKEFKAHLLLLL